MHQPDQLGRVATKSADAGAQEHDGRRNFGTKYDTSMEVPTPRARWQICFDPDQVPCNAPMGIPIVVGHRFGHRAHHRAQRRCMMCKSSPLQSSICAG